MTKEVFSMTATTIAALPPRLPPIERVGIWTAALAAMCPV
jgi:hypothetical protein